MEERYDADTIAKIELINRKVDEINQRRICLPTTKIEDELDYDELEAYIKTLHLTDRQREIVGQFNRKCNEPVLNRNTLQFLIISTGVVLQIYISYEIYRLISQGASETLDVLYLGALIIFFAFNTFQVLRYLRIVR
ncbi:MAG TPA: hypothetical protein VK436_11140 [Methanocella sp.]|nr:hypothetical protein [Methanocella sp.]